MTNALCVYKEHEATYQPWEGHANKLKGCMKITEVKKIQWEITHFFLLNHFNSLINLYLKLILEYLCVVSYI